MTTVDEIMLRLFKVPRFLIVLDDSAPVVGLLHRRYECSVDVTDKGEQAVQLLAENKYDLVIIDVALLNGTSRKVLAAAQKAAPTTPVVATRIQGIGFNEVADFGPVTVISGPLTEGSIDNLFRVFKIKARTRDIAEYCARQSEPVFNAPATAASGA